jgi:hypothetical protein
MWVYIAIFILVLLLSVIIFKRIPINTIHKKLIGSLAVLIGLYFSTLTGSFLAFTVPGVGSIALGASMGAFVGFITFVAIGTIGVATGGTAFALGGLAFTGLGGLFGAIGSSAGGIGFHYVSYPLVHPVLWGSIILLGGYLVVGIKERKKLLLSDKYSSR